MPLPRIWANVILSERSDIAHDCAGRGRAHHPAHGVRNGRELQRLVEPVDILLRAKVGAFSG